jgi:glucose/arabinose dehydrogenase
LNLLEVATRDRVNSTRIYAIHAIMKASSRAVKLLWVALAATSTALAEPSPAAAAATCSTPDSSVPAPSTAPGYKVRLVATDLDEPRGIIFDTAGNLLVIERDSGLVSLKLSEKNNCITVADKTTLLDDGSVSDMLHLV